MEYTNQPGMTRYIQPARPTRNSHTIRWNLNTQFGRLIHSGLLLIIILLAPSLLHAQDISISSDISGLQGVLDQVYRSMIVHCSGLIDISRSIAGFGAFLYISDRIFSHIASPSPIAIYPMLRPFAIGIAIFLFPSLLSIVNGVMTPTVTGTQILVTGSNQAVATLLQQKEQLLGQSSEWQMYVGTDGSGSLQKWEELSGDADSGAFSGITNRLKFKMAQSYYGIRNTVKVWLSEVLEVIFEAAALCINTVRTFYLIILGILGPLAFGLSIFPSFGSGLARWFGKYISVFLWLPITNVFGSLIAQVQAEMIKNEISQLTSTGASTYGAADTVYIIFLLMGIVGYFCIPSIAGYLVNTGNVTSILDKSQQFARRLTTT